MSEKKKLVLRKSGREVAILRWIAPNLPKPWPNTHERVLIPLTPDERRNSDKKFHIQIVRKDALIEVK